MLWMTYSEIVLDLIKPSGKGLGPIEAPAVSWNPTCPEWTENTSNGVPCTEEGHWSQPTGQTETSGRYIIFFLYRIRACIVRSKQYDFARLLFRASLYTNKNRPAFHAPRSFTREKIKTNTRSTWNVRGSRL